MSKNSKKRTFNQKKLDLGLSGLLSEPSLSPEGATLNLQNTTIIEVQAEIKQNQTSQPNQYEILANANSWPELFSLCEKNLSKDENNIETKMWWIKSQFEIGSMPMILLSAALTTATKSLSDHPDLQNLACDLLKKVALKSLAQDELEQAIVHLNQLLEINPSFKSSISSAVLEKFNIYNNKADFQNSRERQKHNRKLKLLQDFIDQYQITNQVITENNHLEKIAAAATSTLIPAAASANPVAEPQAKIIYHNSKTKYLVKGLLLSVLGVIAYYFINNFPNSIVSQSEIAEQRYSLTVKEPTQILLPEVTRSQGLSDLDVLYYNIQNGGNQKSENLTNKTDLEAKPKQQKPNQEPIEQAVIQNSKVENKPKPKETINTNYPLEGTVFSPPASSSASTPKALPEPQLPESSPWQKAPQKDSAPSIYGYEVFQFNPSKTFRLIARTRVQERPSLDSIAVSSLDAGAKVEVIEKMGPWLKLKSRMGRYGFILAQDAEEL